MALVAPFRTPLADEIGRELRASHFEVVRLDMAPVGEDPLRAVPPALARGVLVAPDEGRVTVFERAGKAGEVWSRTDLRIDPRDPQIRRHACFAVVEYLRVMTLGAGAAAGDPAPATGGAPRAPRAAAGAAGGEPAAGPTVTTAASATGIPVLRPRPWTLAVAAKIDLDTGLGVSTTDLQFVWHFRLGEHLGIRALMTWPLVGATVTRPDTSVRLWMFGTGVGLHYAFVATPAPVRPFVGVTLGSRLTLTQSSASAMPNDDGRAVLTPSLNLGVEAGIACRVTRFAELFFDGGAARDRLVPGLTRSGVPAAAASGFSLSSAIGVMLEY